MNQTKESSVSFAIRKTMISSILKSAMPEKNKPAQFTIKIANTLEEREAVFNLAYQVYLAKGYVKESSLERHVQNYDSFSQTTTLIVQDQNKKIAGSLTLIFDEDAGLPVEKIYAEEVKTLRSKGEKLVEISRLVISPEYRNAKEILQLLINYLAIYAHHVKGYSSLVIQVNPRHTTYYKTLLKFEEIGAEKPCPSVQNAPAVLLRLSINLYQSEIKRCAKLTEDVKKERSLYPYFLNPEQEKLVAFYLQKQFKPMTVEEKIYFGFTESGISRAICV